MGRPHSGPRGGPTGGAVARVRRVSTHPRARPRAFASRAGGGAAGTRADAATETRGTGRPINRYGPDHIQIRPSLATSLSPAADLLLGLLLRRLPPPSTRPHRRTRRFQSVPHPSSPRSARYFPETPRDHTTTTGRHHSLSLANRNLAQPDRRIPRPRATVQPSARAIRPLPRPGP